jgi:hypothetical protein
LQFFYLISDIYQQNIVATPKELRRWAYEIFSTFLIPQAPTPFPGIDAGLVQTIDKVLAQQADCDPDVLRKLFVSARGIAIDDINENLADFRQKRQLGFYHFPPLDFVQLMTLISH